MKVNKQVYKKNEDGSMSIVEETQIEVNIPSTEEQIAQKEAKLLKMYEEIQALKNL